MSSCRGNSKILAQRKEIVLTGIRVVGDYIVHEVAKKQLDTHFIFSCFNIISEFGQRYLKIPETIDVIEAILLHLTKYCETKDDFDIQDELFAMLTQPASNSAYSSSKGSE